MSTRMTCQMPAAQCGALCWSVAAFYRHEALLRKPMQAKTSHGANLQLVSILEEQVHRLVDTRWGHLHLKVMPASLQLTWAVLLACRHIPRVHDFLWLAEDGMKMQGYNGSQLWDTAFAVQAISHTGLEKEFAQSLRRAHQYIDGTQVRSRGAAYLMQTVRPAANGHGQVALRFGTNLCSRHTKTLMPLQVHSRGAA